MMRPIDPTGTTSPRPLILLADSDEKTLRALAERLRQAGYEVAAVSDSTGAQQQLRERIPDLALIDVALADEGALALRERLRQEDPDRPVLVLAPGLRPVESWAAELNLPVADLVAKPVSGQALVAAVSRALEGARQARLLRRQGRRPFGFGELLGNSPRWQETLRLAERLARCDETVCLLGETGTGKSHLAEAMHQASARGGNPMVTAVVAPGQPDRQADDLYGHLEGAFTGANQAREGFFRAAHRSTLFLDEVADLSPETQLTLLRALQNRVIRPLGADAEMVVDVRIIVATNKDLLAEVRGGRFREDLYHRLTTLPLTLPPLRDRHDDILLLARHFARRQAEKMDCTPPELAKTTEQSLLGHPWPGNVRELNGCLVRAMFLRMESAQILPEHCGLTTSPPTGGSWATDVLPGESLDAYLERCKRRYFAHLIKTCDGDRKRMATVANLHPSTLREKLKEFGQDREACPGDSDPIG